MNSTAKSHIIILMADQLRRDALGPHTPHLNRLLQESTVFDRCYNTCPLCVPARGSFFTGRYPNETGSIINPWEERDAQYGYVDSDIPNLYTLLEEEYESLHIGKQHLYTENGLEHDTPETEFHTLGAEYTNFLEERGLPTPGGEAFRAVMPEVAMNRFTRQVKYSIPETGLYRGGFEGFFDGYLANMMVKRIREFDSDRPLLLNGMFPAPHPPFEIPEPWYSLVSTNEVTLPENVGVWYSDQSPLQLYNLPGILGTRYSREEWQEPWRVYLGLTAILDHCIGMVLDELRTQNMYEDSLIIFTADHGEMLGSHGLWQKMCCYEEAVHVPFFVKLPTGAPELQRDPAQVISHVDVFPFVLDIAGKDIPEHVTGTSLMQHTDPDREVFIQFDGNGALGNFSRCVVRDNLKLNVDVFKDESYVELYDVEKDPQETRNLAFDNNNDVRDLLGILKNHMSTTRDHLSLEEHIYDDFLDGYTRFRKSADTPEIRI